ncbi:hypothetical protein [Microbacterium sp.]|uniref:hypothetical protein n=1 Tax=Microbacterium sp. TaxID=51671 RepID=UPI0039E66879
MLDGALPPKLELPPEWAGLEPTWEQVRQAAELGMGIYIPYGVWFDYARLGDAGLARLSSLDCRAVMDEHDNVELVAHMTSAMLLTVASTQHEVDLSHLTNLREAGVCGPAMVSAGRAPQLESFSVMSMPGGRRFALREPLVVSPTVTELVLELSRIDLRVLEQVPALEYLALDGAAELDLSYLAGLSELTKLRIFRTRRVRGVEALRACPRLEWLEFNYVAEIDDLNALLTVPVEVFSGSGKAFTPEFAEAAASKPRWYAKAPPQPKQSPFEIRAGEEVVEVAFTAFDWLAGQLGDEDAEVYSGDIEDVISAYLGKTHPEWVSTRLVQFDSEAEQVVLITPNTEVAQNVRAALDKLFLNKRQLRRAFADHATP